jgi:protein-S-isoprenylcysteine O-methyltransferase Ste14
VARPAPAFWNLTKTVPIIAGGSFVLSWFVPKIMVAWQHDAALDTFFFPERGDLGLAVLILGTLLVAWSAVVLAIKGGGTPLPFDAPRRLVVSGPYAWFRNPLVIGLVVQGIGVGIYSGSVLVLLFVAAIALIWNFGIRPAEEDALQKVFGRDFELYRREVRCWLPMRRAWTPPPHTGPISLEELPAEMVPKRRRR